MQTSNSGSKSKRSAKSLAAKITTNFKTIRASAISTSPKTVSAIGLMSPTSPTAAAAHKGSIFGMKLDEMMRRQSGIAPSLEIPVPLVVLAHAILHQSGATTEGVFRIPAPSSELQRLIKQFDGGNFIIDFNPSDDTLPPSVHCLAGALKKLLRESPDSLIPGSSYDRAIAITQETHSLAAQNLVGTLPLVNKRVTMFLIRFLQEFLHPDCVAKSKMTLDNIAMVFAPTVLRSPSEDLNVMVANSLHEKAFVRLLLETQPSFAWWALPGENPPPNLSSDLSNSPRLTLEVIQSMLDSIAFSSTPPLRPLTPSAAYLTPPLSLSASPSSTPPLSFQPETPPQDLGHLNIDSSSYRRRSHSLDYPAGDSSPIPIPRSNNRERAWTAAADNYEEDSPQKGISISAFRKSRPPPPPRPRRNFPPSAASTPPSAESAELAGEYTTVAESVAEELAVELEATAAELDTINEEAISSPALEEEITRLKAMVAQEMSARVLAEEEAKRCEAETKRIMQERDILERAQLAQRDQIDRLRDQLDAARADAFTTQAQAESARELSEAIRANEANAQRELAAARAEAARAREEAQRALEDKNKVLEEKRKEVEDKAKEVAAKTKEVEEKARLVQEKTREAENARKEAETARGEGERAKVKAESDAERVRKEMEKAKADAEAARAELDRARREADEAIRRQVDAAGTAVAQQPEEEESDEEPLFADENDENVLARVRAGPTHALAEQRDAIVAELVFLATRIAYAGDIGLLMELSKVLRTIRHSLDGLIQAAGMEEWQIAQLCRIYTSCLPSLLLPLEDLPSGDPPGPQDPHTDIEKVRKMRTIALHASRACIDLVSALVVFSILGGRSSPEAKQTLNQFNAITSKLIPQEQKLVYIKREAKILVNASEKLAIKVKNAFPTTPADKLADLARPIIALVKDLDNFFAWAGLDVPVMGSPVPDDRVTDERLRRVRTMLFMALNKVGAQASLMRNSLDHFDPSDPRVMPTIERIHLIVEALEVSASPN